MITSVSVLYAYCGPAGFPPPPYSHPKPNHQPSSVGVSMDSSGIGSSVNLTTPRPRKFIIVSFDTAFVVKPVHAGYPKSARSKNIANGKFL